MLVRPSKGVYYPSPTTYLLGERETKRIGNHLMRTNQARLSKKFKQIHCPHHMYLVSLWTLTSNRCKYEINARHNKACKRN